MKSKARLTLSLQVHNFQRRFRFMLSSLAQQSLPEAVHVIAACRRGNGVPSTEDLARAFQGRVSLQLDYWDGPQFQYRGLTRNRHLAMAETEWVMFSDCDLVFHPHYVARLLEELDGRHASATYMLSSGRMSNPKEEADHLVADFGDGAGEVPMAWGLADALAKRPMKNVGAGFCQIVHRTRGAHGGVYVDPRRCQDWSWTRGSNPKSDIQFRRRMAAGGPRVALPDWFSRATIHLNHDRDPEAGTHLETQR